MKREADKCKLHLKIFQSAWAWLLPGIRARNSWDDVVKNKSWIAGMWGDKVQKHIKLPNHSVAWLQFTTSTKLRVHVMWKRWFVFFWRTLVFQQLPFGFDEKVVAVQCYVFGVERMSSYIVRKIGNVNEIPFYSDILSVYTVVDVWVNICDDEVIRWWKQVRNCHVGSISRQ